MTAPTREKFATILEMLSQFEAELPDHVTDMELASVYMTRILHRLDRAHGRTTTNEWLRIITRQDR